MSNSENGAPGQAKVRMEIKASSPMTEITVRNARFEPLDLDSNVGQTSLEVEPGVFQVSFREGPVIDQQTIAVLPGKQIVRVDQPRPVGLPSANPVMDTSTTHEWHQAPAQGLSREVHDVIGDGASSLFLFVRDIGTPIVTRPEKAGSAARPQVFQWPSHDQWLAPAPALGLSLHDPYGTLLCDLSSRGRSEDDYHYFGVTIALPEGSWRLRVTTAAGDRIEMPVVTRAAWQTQVFALSSDYGTGGPETRANLDTASVAMAYGHDGYRADSLERFFEETALKALASGRTLRGDSLNQLLHGKFENPIWGLVGAHLLLLRPDPDLYLLQMVLDNTENMLGGTYEPHPDIVALRHKLALLRGEPLDGLDTLPFPPMLARSWRHVLEANAVRPDLIPIGSPSLVLAPSISEAGPWLKWVNPEPMTAPAPPSADDPPQMAQDVIGDLLRAWAPDGARRAVKNVLSILDSSEATKLIFEDQVLQNFDREIALQLRPAIDPAVQQLVEDQMIEDPESEIQKDLASDKGETVSPVEWLSERLRVPQNTVIQSLGRIQQKLEQSISDKPDNED